MCKIQHTTIKKNFEMNSVSFDKFQGCSLLLKKYRSVKHVNSSRFMIFEEFKDMRVDTISFFCGGSKFMNYKFIATSCSCGYSGDHASPILITYHVCWSLNGLTILNVDLLNLTTKRFDEVNITPSPTFSSLSITPLQKGYLSPCYHL